MRGVMLFFALWAAFSLPSNAMVVPSPTQQQQQLDSLEAINKAMKQLPKLPEDVTKNEPIANMSTGSNPEKTETPEKMETPAKTEKSEMEVIAPEVPIKTAAKTEIKSAQQTNVSQEINDVTIESELPKTNDKKRQKPIKSDTILMSILPKSPECVLPESATIYQLADYAICQQLQEREQSKPEPSPEDGSGFAVVVGTVPGGFDKVIMALDSNELRTFAYCTVLAPDECRAVLLFLERIADSEELAEQQNSVELIPPPQQQQQQQKQQQQQPQHSISANKPEGETDAIAGALTSHRRKRRSLDEERRLLQVLERYRKWRKKNGYGKAVGRWGRDVADFADNVHEPIAHRMRRAAEIPVDMLKMLKLYKAWRAKYGYGKAVGRWGR